MNVSVIIPVWNGRQYLSSCLDALLAQIHSNDEVVVVDNASSDGSGDFVAQSYPEVRLVRNPYNFGFSGGCNVGIRAARRDLLVLLNQDTRVYPGWLSTIADALQDPLVGVIGCKILYPDGETLQHAGGWVELPLGLTHHYGSLERDLGQWDLPEAVDYVTGAAMAFRRETVERVGLLDEGFWPGYFEDADFCFRARQAEYRVMYLPQAVLIHHETTSMPDPLERSRLYQRGRLRFVLKHVSPEQFLKEFLPAELNYQPPAIRALESKALRLAYLESIPAVPGLLKCCWQADERTIAEVTSALHSLYSGAWYTDWQVVEESVRVVAGPQATPATTIPARIVPNTVLPEPVQQIETVSEPLPLLKESEFHSNRPFIGRWLAGLYRIWYRFGLRRVIRDLIRQQEGINHRQEAINHQQEAWHRRQEDSFREQEEINRRHDTLGQQQEIYIQALAKQVADLAEENALLAKIVAGGRPSS